MITTLAVENYRSLRRLVVPLGRLNVITGASGTGKSSLYRALRLLADSGHDCAIAALAHEGGLPSVLWADPETAGRVPGRAPVHGADRSPPSGLRFGFAGDEYGYAVDFGPPTWSGSAFSLDPEIKREAIWTGPVLRPTTILTDRAGPAVRVRGADGGWSTARPHLPPYSGILGEPDLQGAPDVLRVREQLRSWRFYDRVRTDARAPARVTRLGTRTPVLGHDGADLAAALETIREIGDRDALDTTVAQAFPGSHVEIRSQDGRFELGLHQHGLVRPLGAAELSDGTLRYLLWVAALLTPRPPGLLVLNEPETGLHPDLLRPLAELIRTAAARTQLVVVTHSRPFAVGLAQAADREGLDLSPIELVKEFGETRVAGQAPPDEPPWQWPRR